MIDLRVDGVYHNCMRSPEGRDYWSRGNFREIVEPARLVYTDSFSDEDGNIVPATSYGMSPHFPLVMLVSVTFDEQGGGTLMTLRHAGIPGGRDQELCNEGWSQSFDKLAELLERLKKETSAAKAA